MRWPLRSLILSSSESAAALHSVLCERLRDLSSSLSSDFLEMFCCPRRVYVLVLFDFVSLQIRRPGEPAADRHRFMRARGVGSGIKTQSSSLVHACP
jgi:hypothetical protein